MSTQSVGDLQSRVNSTLSMIERCMLKAKRCSPEREEERELYRLEALLSMQ